MPTNLAFDPIQSGFTTDLLKSRMAPNNDGGLSYTIDKWARLNRFLLMGVEGSKVQFPTGQNKAEKLTIENARCLLECILESGLRVVNEIVAISDSGRAVKNSPAIFALAVCASAGDKDNEADALKVRQAALDALPKVCRTGTHLFEFAEYVNSMRGWGRGLKRAIQDWYGEKDLEKLAYQLVKYQQRNGWSHSDLLRLSKPAVGKNSRSDLYRWVRQGPVAGVSYPDIVCAFEEAKTAPKERVIELIKTDGLTREMIPTEMLPDPAVQKALLFHAMPLTALIRNLANLTGTTVTDMKSGKKDTKPGIFYADAGQVFFDQETLTFAIRQITDGEYIRKQRIHPVTVLIAKKQYEHGRSEQKDSRGHIVKVTTWKPIPALVRALEEAFYKAFINVEPTGKNFCIGLDVSGSMELPIPGSDYISACEFAAAITMTIARKEPNYATVGFATNIVKLGITAEDTLAQAMCKAQMSNFGSTNPAALIRKARQERLNADVFIVITDNDCNSCHASDVSRELQLFRREMNKPHAKMIVLATSASNFTIADPNDSGQLDICGFDAAVPQLINAFVRE